MYIQETSRRNLYILDTKELSMEILYEYFYHHRKLEYIHFESEGKYIGYVDLASLSQFSRDNTVSADSLCKALVVPENTSGATIHELLESLSDINVVVKSNTQGQLVSTYSRVHPECIDKDSLAISILPAFQKEVAQNLKELSAEIFIKAEIDDADYIKGSLVDINIANEYKEECLILTKGYKKFILKHFYPFASFISLDTLLEKVLLKIFLNYAKTIGIQTIFIQGPIKDKLNVTPETEPFLFKKASMGEALQDSQFIQQFFLNDESDILRAKDPNFGLMAGSHVISNGIHLVNSELHSETMNVDADGKRVTINTLGEKRNVWCFGSCLTYGLFGKDSETFPSQLQGLANDTNISIRVHNCGVKGSNNLLNDLLYAFNTNITEGDVLVFVSLFNQEQIALLQQYGVLLNDFSTYLNQNPCGSYCFLDNTFHCNKKIYTRLAEYVFSLLPKGHTTSKIQHNYFLESGKIGLIDYEKSLGQVMYNDYINYITSKKLSINKIGRDAKIGSMVITANPFTFGHAFLVDTAAKECDIVYVFVVEENNFQYTFLERYKMVENYCKRYKNVVVLESGLYLTPVYDFPEYFARESSKGNTKQTPTLHSLFFGRFIAKALDINVRYVGEELRDTVTMHFNEYLGNTLPQFGVELVVLKRNTTSKNITISASYVRKCIKEGVDSSELEEFLPTTTIDVIRERVLTFS